MSRGWRCQWYGDQERRCVPSVAVELLLNQLPLPDVGCLTLSMPQGLVFQQCFGGGVDRRPRAAAVLRSDGCDAARMSG